MSDDDSSICCKAEAMRRVLDLMRKVPMRSFAEVMRDEGMMNG